MTDIVPEEQELDPILVQAADWFVRMTSGQATAEDARALEQWRAEDPRHESAFTRLSAMYAANAQLGRDRKGRRRRDVLLGIGGVMAASATAYGVVRPPMGLWPSLAALMADYRTSPGQRRTLALAAGVSVDMNSGTSLSRADAGAGIRLIEGEAFVSIAPRQRPFLIDTEGGRLSARAAKFNVRFLSGILNVACVEGALACAASGAQTTLQAGEALSVARGGPITRTRVDPAAAVAWRRGLLVFRGEALSSVVAQLNLYRPGRVILASPDVGRRAVVGVFHTGQIDNALEDIHQLLGLELRRLPGGVVLIG